MRENGSLSILTFRARPWKEQPRRMRGLMNSFITVDVYARRITAGICVDAIIRKSVNDGIFDAVDQLSNAHTQATDVEQRSI